MGQLPHAPAGFRTASSFAVTRCGEVSSMSGKAVVSLTTGLEDPEKVTVAFLVAVAAAEQQRPTLMLLGDPVDFQALTPVRHWQAGTGRQAVEEIILAWWFGAGDDIIELCSVTPGRVLDREHVAYRVRVRREGRDYVVE